MGRIWHERHKLAQGQCLKHGLSLEYANTNLYMCVCMWQLEDTAFAAWLPEWWNHGSAWQQVPSEPSNPEEPFHGQDEEDRHLLGQSLVKRCQVHHLGYLFNIKHGSRSAFVPCISFHVA